MTSRLLLLISCCMVLVPAFAQVITTIAGTGTPGYTGDGGPAVQARLSSPTAICMDRQGNLFFSDWFNRTIRRINPSGTINTFAGNGITGYSGDGGPALLASLHTPDDIEFDVAGNMYVAEHGNHVIRKIDLNGRITTIAGNGSPPPNGVPIGDGGPAILAQLYTPEEIAVDAAGNIYIADVSTNSIRRINAAGVIHTIAGGGFYHAGYSGDGGPAVSAKLNAPVSIEVDQAGNIYFSDLGNHVVRKISTMGIITTIAGNGTPGYSGDGGPAIQAQLNRPNGLAIDNHGNIYVVEEDNHVIRKIDVQGNIFTVAGTGVLGYSGDGGPATQAKISSMKIEVSPSGDLYLTDHVHHVIRKISACPTGGNITVNINSPEVSSCENDPVHFTAVASGNGAYSYQWKQNGKNVGTNSSSLILTTLKNGDQVHCVVTSQSDCPVSTSSNILTMVVNPLPRISFSEDHIISPGESVQLNPILNGLVDQYAWTPPEGLSNTSIKDPVSSPSSTTTYQLKAVSPQGCIGYGQVTVRFSKKLMMPDAFSPNHDGRNEIFRIPPGTGFRLRRFSVFDRWGQIIFQTSDISEGWNGKIRNHPAPSGLYIYLISGNDDRGYREYKGTVMLIR
jgi:gliding motility-associated-like protein